MSLKRYKPQEFVSSILGSTVTFSPEKQEEGEFVWNEVQILLQSIQENLPKILDPDEPSELFLKYRFLTESITYTRTGIKFFELCRIELGTEFYVKHTKNSLHFYVFGRKFLTMAMALLKEILHPEIYLNYSEVSKYSSQLSEFTYPRKLYFFNLLIKAIRELFSFQRSTNSFLLNWELRLDVFFVCRSSLDYNDLLQNTITDPFLMEKTEIIRLLSMSYEVLISDLKKEYEKTKQHFFFQNVLVLLDEFKRFNVIQGNTEKARWLDQNMVSWRRMSQYGKKG